jgi:hypothetical protein
MGQPFALREVAPVLLELARVYLDTVWQGEGTRRRRDVSGREVGIRILCPSAWDC